MLHCILVPIFHHLHVSPADPGNRLCYLFKYQEKRKLFEWFNAQFHFELHKHMANNSNKQTRAKSSYKWSMCGSNTNKYDLSGNKQKKKKKKNAVLKILLSGTIKMKCLSFHSAKLWIEFHDGNSRVSSDFIYAWNSIILFNLRKSKLSTLLLSCFHSNHH